MPSNLVAPVKRISAPNTPAPFTPPMEKLYVPDAQRIAREIRELMKISQSGCAPRRAHRV